MGLGDCLHQGERSPEVTLRTQTHPVRKKSSFDIAFLTGQSEERESSEHQSEESCSGGSSDSSIIDILTDPVVSPSHSKERKRKRKVTDPSGPSSDKSLTNDSRISPIGGVELVIPQLTSPFHFLPHFKTGPLTHFAPPFVPIPPSSSTGTGPLKSRRTIFGHSQTSSESHFYPPPYHPFMAPPPEPTNQAASSHQPTNQSPPPLTTPTLLPPSLAALSLPAQNVCAKCKIGFRMTSDLVYHMRSHHKRETDPQQKRREEKLKCPVCHETFRERHHLTRHMTAHQDRKEELELGNLN